MVYFRAVQEGDELTALFICETGEAMRIFREEHQNLERQLGVKLNLITATYAEVTAGKKSGDTWIMNGTAVQLS